MENQQHVQIFTQILYKIIFKLSKHQQQTLNLKELNKFQTINCFQLSQ